MLDAGGGGGGGTSWSAMDVPTMWSTIESQETTPHWEMLTGWRRSFELILQHMSQVRNYRENLASAWPPERSPASAAYVAELDALLTNLQQTYDAAVANHTAFSTATLSLSSARTELKQIYDAYTANQAKLDEFDAKPKPVQYGKAPLPPQKPPVTGAQQEQLNNRARAVMSGLSIELVQARMSLTTPAKYKPPARVLKDGEPDNAGNTAPAIPPIVPVFPSDDGNVRAGGSSVHPPAQAVVGPSTPSPSPGLVLGGAQPGLVPPPTAGQFPTPLTPVTSGPLPGIISPATVVPLSPIGGPAKPSALPTIGQPLTRGSFTGSNSTGGGRPMAPGGVIGTMPGMVPNGPGAPPARVNPIGGLINAPSQPPTGGKSGVGYPMSTVAGRPVSPQDQSETPKRWDPDDPWHTDEGVPPVLAPMPEQRVDPGPAIGLV